MSVVKVPGVEHDFYGEVLVIPPLNLRAMEQLTPRLAAYKGEINEEGVKTVIDTVHAALSRNYPGMTRDQVADLVDLGNMVEVMAKVMDVSGVKRKAAEAKKTMAATEAGA